MDHMLRATSCLFLPTVSTGLHTKKETMTRYPKIAILFIHFAAGSERRNGSWLAFQVISFSAVMVYKSFHNSKQFAYTINKLKFCAYE